MYTINHEYNTDLSRMEVIFTYSDPVKDTAKYTAFYLDEKDSQEVLLDKFERSFNYFQKQIAELENVR